MKYLSRLLKRARPSTIINCKIDKTGKIGSNSHCLDSSLGRFSYCGFNCLIINTRIGNFCSIADDVTIGNGHHPLDWVSSSCAFYKGRDSISKRLATLSFDTSAKETVIENDVWIGMGARIKSGVTIGNGAVIGMGAIVTHDIPPYAIVAGSPARIIKYRFDETTVEKLLKTQWWDFDEAKLKELSQYFNDVQLFLEKAQEYAQKRG